MNVKSKKEMMRDLRLRRKDAGLVYYRAWVTKSEQRYLKEQLELFRKKGEQCLK